jgi:outer membrane protein assembly factor BamB
MGALLPLPTGGVAAQQGDQLIGLLPTSDRLWAVSVNGAIFDHVIDHDRILFTTKGNQAATYAITKTGQLTKLADIGGKIAVSRERVFVYNPTGLYRLNEGAAELVLPLDDARFTDGQVAAAYDGTLLVAHHGYFDRRLIVLNADGSLRWDRSVQGLGRALPQLAVIGRSVYAVTSNGDVLLIDLATGESRRVFDGGGPTFVAGRMWAQPLPNGRLAFDFRSGRLIVLDPRAALPVAEVEQ